MTDRNVEREMKRSSCRRHYQYVQSLKVILLGLCMRIVALHFFNVVFGKHQCNEFEIVNHIRAHILQGTEAHVDNI